MAARAKGRPLPVRIVAGRPRLFFCLAMAIVVGIALPASVLTSTRLLLAWNAGTWLYFALTALLIAHATPEKMQVRAQLTDEGKFVVLILTVVAAGVSLAAIFVELAAVKTFPDKGLHLGLAAVTIVSAWSFIHLTFAQHYAHEYYDLLKDVEHGKPRHVGGLLFPDEEAPDYLDFMYFSFIIGVASQTADVGIGSRAMRRTSLVHSVVAFFFNSAILALTINIAAGLI
jgi:uncharacterized membrane protein